MDNDDLDTLGNLVPKRLAEALKAENLRLRAEVDGLKANNARLKAEVVRLNQESRRFAQEAGYVEMTWIVTPDQAKRLQDRLDLWESCEEKNS
jgi:acetylglutamate kinase